MATSTSDAAMILRNCVKIEQLVDPIPPVEAILRRCNKKQVENSYFRKFRLIEFGILLIALHMIEIQLFSIFLVQIMDHYGIADFQTAHEFLALLARRQGKLKKGGLPDSDKAAKSVLMDWTG